MTDADRWATLDDPWVMMDYVEQRASARKLRLFAVACCRRAAHLTDDPRHHAGLAAAERLADDDQIAETEWERLLQPVVALWADIPDSTIEAWRPHHYLTAAVRHIRGRGSVKYAADFAARGLATAQAEEDSPAWEAARRAEAAVQAGLLRDVIGSPLRPFAFDPVWLASAGRPAVERAWQIEAAGRSEVDHMADLAIVLERAGCRNRAVLDHCGGPGPHVRGCWVVDALLGRETAVLSGLLTEADWLACDDPTSLLAFLHHRGTERQWRRFAVACCRRVESFMRDDRSRRAVDVADRLASGTATDAELAEARTAAEKAEREAAHAEYGAEPAANFCITPTYAAISRALYAAKAALSAIRPEAHPERFQIDIPDPDSWAASHYWAAAVIRSDVESSAGEPNENVYADGPKLKEVKQAVARAKATERCAQRDLLVDLFGDLLGPPGEDGAWLPCGSGASASEWWCRLPTPHWVDLPPGWLARSNGAIPQLARGIRDDEAFDRLPLLADLLEVAGCADLAILDHLRGLGPHIRGCWVVERLISRDSAGSPF